MSEPEQNVVISFDVEIPHEAVSAEELDLIEAHFSPLIRQLLTEIALLDK